MKRILIVNTVQIGENSGTGNTLNNIFKLYPQDKLMQLLVLPYLDEKFSSIPTINTPLEVCRLSYRVMLKRRDQRLNSKKAPTDILPAAISIRSPRTILKDVLRAGLDAWPVCCKSLYRQLDEFKPEVIYTCAGSIRIMKVVNRLAAHYKIPVVVHLMDDWPKLLYTSSVLALPMRLIMKHELAKLYKHSQTNFAISEGLCQKYEKIYAKKHVPLMNPSKIRPANNSAASSNSNGKIKFLYAGSLELRRNENLLEMAEVLKKLNAEGLPNQFDIYTAKKWIISHPKNAFAQYDVSLHEYVPIEKVYDLYSEYDVLIFTESFAKEIADFTALSLSTKVPEYLASAKAVVAYLPECLFSGRYLKANNLACVINEKAALYRNLKRLMTDNAYRADLAATGYNEAVEKFSTDCVKQKLMSVFA